MSNINKNSHATKLRGNEMSIKLYQNRSNYGSNLQIDSVASGSVQISNPEIVSKPYIHKCGGRGMAIQQLSESIKSSKGSMKNSNLDFSNSNIERHFKNLKEENEKKLKEENEKIWGKLIHSNKKT